MTSLADIQANLDVLPPEQRAQVIKDAEAATARFKSWIPNPGPQTQAYFCPADILLYGGEAGGGKSELLLGLAFNEHSRSLIMRREYTELDALTERAIEINGTRNGFNGGNPPKLQIDADKILRFGAAKNPGDEHGWKGRPRDLLGLDEAVEFLEAQVRFLMGWVRSADPGQRTRTVLATNPPVDASGDWIIAMFRPWLDVTHPNPAQHGELRWFITDEAGQDEEVSGPEPIERNGEVYKPKSRTFIPAGLSDNPYLIDSGYKAELDSLPEPWRSAYRDGNFMAKRADGAMQVIPSDWVKQAQARWKPGVPRDVQMTALGVDVAEAVDMNILSPRYEGWYAPLVCVPGKEAPDGSSKAALVVRHRRGNAALVIDVGGGYAGGLIERLKDNKIPFSGFNGAHKSFAHTRDGKLEFKNKRAEAWWKFREALDPDQDGGSPVDLPDDPALLADLTAPTFKVGTGGIVIESKEEIKKRLGRSTDRGDGVVMAWSEGDYAVSRGLGGKTRARPKVNLGYEKMKKRRRQ